MADTLKDLINRLKINPDTEISLKTVFGYIEYQVQEDFYKYPSIIKSVRDCCSSCKGKEEEALQLFYEVNLRMSGLILSKDLDDWEVIEYAQLLNSYK